MTELGTEFRFSQIVTVGPKRDKKITMNVNDLSRLPLVCRICLTGCTLGEPIGEEVQARTIESRRQLELIIGGEMSKKLKAEGRSPVCEAMSRWPSSPDPVV